MRKGQFLNLIYFVSLGIIFILLTQRGLYASIVGSSHDFSGMSSVHGKGEICKVCHVPHNGGSNEVPLWRGSLSSAISYTLYSSDTLNTTVSQPLVPTKACLTCHDGSIAKGPVAGCQSCHNVHGGDTNLSDDHPVSFTFDSALAQEDGALHDPNSTSVSNLGGRTIEEAMLYQGRMECTSCHDVHATKGDSDTTTYLLLVDNEQSNLCLTCHIK